MSIGFKVKVKMKAIWVVAVAVCAFAAGFATPPNGALAASAGPGWSITSMAQPTNFSAADTQDQREAYAVEATEGTYELEVEYGFGAAEKRGTTIPIEWDENHEGVQRQLEALAAIGKENVTVTGGPGDATGSKAYEVSFDGSLTGTSVGVIPTDEKLEGGKITVQTVAEAKAHDRYLVVATNIGGSATEGEVTVEDALPPAVVPVEARVEEPHTHYGEACSVSEPVRCGYNGAPIEPGQSLLLTVEVAIPSASITGPLLNKAAVLGGGAAEASTNTSNPVNAGPAGFGVEQAAFEAVGPYGAPDFQAGGHPYGVTTRIALNTVRSRESEGGVPYDAAQEARELSTLLPAGFLGDALAAERCSEVALAKQQCPPGSLVGAVTLRTGSGWVEDEPLYNVVPDHGYPAELGFTATLPQPTFLYASVVATPAGYRLQIASPAALRGSLVDLSYLDITVWGDPTEHNGTPGGSAFLTNPSACTGEPLNARVDVTSWEGETANRETIAYPEITGCNLLTGAASFSPSLQLEPEETDADTPSGFQVDLKVPQAPNVFGQVATPDLKNATVTLPEGVSLSPSAASGGPNALEGCTAEGPHGINIGSDDVAPDGQDLGDPEATELGEGHPGGDNSPYDDGMWHSAPGHCPEKSRIGTVEVKTPLLSEPMTGHVYVAQPQCGDTGQPECTPASAEDGQLYGIYLEMSGEGVIIKLKGKVHVNPSTGQITTSFSENPQLPFEELRLNLTGGQRSALANPQTSGTYTTTSDLEPWSAPESGPNATPSWPFVISGYSSGSMPFKPGFEAGVQSTLAGDSGAFTMTLTRNDGEQDIGGVSLTLPEGSAGLISKVSQCDEAQANAGTCPESARIGTAHVAAGAGSEPLWLEGPVYLTGPYKGDPFGLSVVVPAKAGPYNLGNEVVRAGIAVNPTTAQVTVTSEPLRLIRDGVPFRIKEINVTVNKPGFMLNPTDCSQLSVTGTVTGEMPNGSAGSTVAVSSPFAVTGCKDLPFKPTLTAETHAYHTKKRGAYLKVTIKAKEGEANLAKVHVTLPEKLPSELETLKKSCTEAQFATNPADCPKASFVGSVVVHTPVLSKPLEGPAIFESHGHAKEPDLAFVLQGEGVTIIQEGETNISKKGFTTSSFNAIPDLPVSSIEVTLPESEKPALGGEGNFCTKSVTKRVRSKVDGRTVYRKKRVKKKVTLTMPTKITGQNGAVVEQKTTVKVTGCAATKKTTNRKSGRSA